MHIMASFRSCGSAMERASKEIPCLVCDLSEPLTNLFAFRAPSREFMHIHEKAAAVTYSREPVHSQLTITVMKERNVNDKHSVVISVLISCACKK